jgi:hypothetical protein
MNILQIITLIAIALSGYPIGLFIACNTKEELKDGRKWFKWIMIACAFGILLSLLFLTGNELILALVSSVFIFGLAMASL